MKKSARFLEAILDPDSLSLEKFFVPSAKTLPAFLLSDIQEDDTVGIQPINSEAVDGVERIPGQRAAEALIGDRAVVDRKSVV